MFAYDFYINDKSKNKTEYTETLFFKTRKGVITYKKSLEKRTGLKFKARLSSKVLTNKDNSHVKQKRG